jgi:hypothetical protein
MQKPPVDSSATLDRDTESVLARLSEQEMVRANRIPVVRTVLVSLSSEGMVYDVESLRHKILSTYAEAAVFFQTTKGRPLGAPAPQQIDLLIDFTGPGQRQCYLHAKRLRRRARVTVGRNAGLFRKRIYDRVSDEQVKEQTLMMDLLEYEREIQRKVLELAGISSL